ncbi:DnaT-like ssDNA-binding domain-containing protein [Enterobacter asburiae]|uniref:DnaT-like ssDNA-binding domain-containing protein n=1 Tax=Enterobacter asburiae TaxID=61645 RepID=UPI00192B8565|nr:DnaT-like ssDNA-binding domain-containing protein [Enterobacter asburiae]MBL5924985.1 helix-turn-helix domain-containing protein [Enterobacter asburiae]MBL5956384.1 helix-turn-helix domain-containing protein [Enterobacter asburiae]
MSSKLHGLVWEGCAQAGLGISRVALMARLADYSNADGVSWPAIETLMIEIGAKSDTTIKTALKELVRDGWIKKTERKLGGRNLSNVYQINLEKLEAAAAEGKRKIQEARAKKRGLRELPPGEEDKGAKFNPSNNAPLNTGNKGANFDGSNFEGSKIDENGELTPPKIAPDPSFKTDPSLNPTHNACEEVVEPDNKNPVPEYAGQPGVFFPASQMIGKFPMSKDWTPSADFRQRAAYWGQPVPESMDRKALMAALASFTDYWISEQKVFSQTQWEQKLARHLQNTRPIQPRGNNHAELDQYPPTYNAAQRRMLDARRAQLRERGQSLGVLGLDDGNLLQSLDGQKRPDPVGPMDCADWEFDQRPDDERL